MGTRRYGVCCAVFFYRKDAKISAKCAKEADSLIFSLTLISKI